MKKLVIIEKKTDELIPYINNARTHNDEQVTQIASSIKEFGFNNPVLLDGENGIIAGHGRLLAAKKLGLEKVPCIELSHLSEVQKKAYILADNKIALNSGWDYNLLNIEIEELSNTEIDLSLFGFNNNSSNKNDFSYLDELVNENINEVTNTTADQFDVTFVFPKTEEKIVKDYIKNKGKQNISNMIIELAKKEIENV